VEADAADYRSADPVDAAPCTVAIDIIPRWRETIAMMVAAVRPGGRLGFIGFGESSRAPFAPLTPLWRASAVVFGGQTGRPVRERVAAMADEILNHGVFAGFSYLLVAERRAPGSVLTPHRGPSHGSLGQPSLCVELGQRRLRGLEGRPGLRPRPDRLAHLDQARLVVGLGLDELGARCRQAPPGPIGRRPRPLEGGVRRREVAPGAVQGQVRGPPPPLPLRGPVGGLGDRIGVGRVARGP
jgi:hypothetical protein